MSQPPRRVEISFEREIDALRGIADVVSSLRRSAKRAERPSTLVTRPRAEGSTADASPAQSTAGSVSRPAPVSKAGRYLATLNDAYGPIAPASLAAEIPFVDTLVLDSTALDELARGSERARAHVARAVGSLCRIVVPATALTTTTQQRIAELLAEVVVTDVAHARLGALLLARVPSSDPFDALVVATVSRAERAGIVTTRSAAIERLVAASGRPNVYVFPI